MTKPCDFSKFRRGITKSITGLSVGFNDPKIWIDSGSKILNYLISGSFNKGFPLGKVSILAGEPSAGKSLLSANVIRNAQKMGVYVILIDSENALDEEWIKAFDVDTSEDAIMKLNMAMVNDVAKTIFTFVEEYKTIPVAERPPILFVIDSLGMLLVEAQVNQFAAGDLKGDFGHKAKALKALVTNCVNMFGTLGIGLLATNHTYESQNIFSPDAVVSGGNGPIFAASIVVALKQGKLKEDADGTKTSNVHGIRAIAKIMKSRFSQPFLSAELKIPYSTGLDEYSGLFEFFLENEYLVKDGNRYVYTDTHGRTHTYFKKEWNRNINGALDLIMNEFDTKIPAKSSTLEEEITEE
jgi:recombination protein RecA